MIASDGVDCSIRGLRYVEVDTHIVAVGSRLYMAQLALRYAPGQLIVLHHSDTSLRLGPVALGGYPPVGPSALPATLGPSALGVTDLSALIHQREYASKSLHQNCRD
jgi:hypothetical protein